MPDKAHVIIGYDTNGIPRVSATDANIDIAETMCKEEALEYVKGRPDTGPLSHWIFMNENKGWVNGRIPN